jgi:hypothetical protein
MAILNTDIAYRLSGGGSNTLPASSLGGAKSSTAAGTDLFDNVSSSEATSGDTEYRCIYVHNGHASLTWTSPKIWIQSNTPSTDTAITIGLGTSAVNATEQTVADEGTAPSGVSFVTAVDETNGVSLGDIPFGQHRAVWIKRVVTASAAAYNNDTFTVRAKGDTAA